MLVFDCTGRESFNNIESWMDEIEQYAPEDVMKIIVSNKVDVDTEASELLKHTREICSEEGKAKADSLNCQYFETSARTGYGVQEMFLTTAEKLCELKQFKPKLEKENGGT